MMAGVWSQKWRLSLVMVAGLILAALALRGTPSHSAAPLRLGLMGDSITDEYQGSDPRGGDYQPTSYNWIEQLIKGGRVYAGEWGNWDEPRRTGYAYNWARSGATAGSLIESGQHTGLAEQVKAGEIDVVFLGVGANDFAPYRVHGYEPIYNGSLNDTEVQAKVDKIIADITLAVDTIQAAGNVPIVVATIGDWNYAPGVFNDWRFADGGKRLRVSRAIAEVNKGITALAATHTNVYVVNEQALLLRLLPQAAANDGQLSLGGEAIKMLSHGDEPHNGMLGDNIHAGTVLSGYMANFFLDAFNQVYDPDLIPLSDDEILAAAGL